MKACEFWNEESDPLLDLAKSFSAIGPRHTFFPHVCRFRSLLADDRVLGEMQENISDRSDGQVYASLTARFSPNQGWELKRICWSRQNHDELSAYRFRALSVIYSTQSGGIECFVFPEDPRLKAIPSFFQRKSIYGGQREAGSEMDILRYIPGRRLTFRALGPAGESIIGKFARRSEIRKAYERLARVSAVSSHSQSYFSVPSPLAIEENQGLFFQEARPGRDLTAQIAEDNFVDLLHSVGQIHQHLHRLPIEAPEWNPMVFVKNLSAAVEWIKLFQPEQEVLLNDLRDFLVSNCPSVEAAEYSFCHGDFSCRQVLNEGGSWSVVDFDRCMRADPYWETARFLAFLKYDVALFRDWFLDRDSSNHSRLEEAYAAYLNGYERAAGRTLNRKKLLWHRSCAEIHHLGRLLKRDIATPVAFERSIELIHNLAGDLRARKEIGFDELSVRCATEAQHP